MLFVLVLLEIWPLIDAFVDSLGDLELRGDAPEIARLEIANLELTIEDDCESRGLHAADGGDVAGARPEHALRQGAGAVDPDEPVALAPAARGIGETGHLRAVAQVPKGFADAFGRHRLHPGALHRELRFRELVKIAEDQLAFAPGVAGVDDGVDVFAVEQLFQLIVAALRICDRLQAELFRNDRERLKAPEAVFLFVDVLRHLELDDVAHRRGDDVFVVLVVVAFLGDLAEGTSEVASDARFLRDDEGFGHEGMPTRPPWPALQVTLPARNRARSEHSIMIGITSRSTNPGLGKLHEILSGKLFHEVLQLQAQEDRRDGRAR